MDDKTNKIKELVKTLKAKANTIPNLGINSLAGFMLACDDVIAFIDSLQEEHASEDLEEAARKWEDKVYIENGWQDECGTPHAPFSEIGNAFMAGAEWQKQQMKEALQTEYEKGRFDMMDEIERGTVELVKPKEE